MKARMCAQCGAELEDKVVTSRSRTFCCDECCEEFELGAAAASGPDAGDLDDDFDDDDFDEDDLDFEDEDEDEDFEFDDDDFGSRDDY